MPPRQTTTLPRDSRLIALIVSQYCDKADPAVIAMLTEFAHRYTSDVLSDALVYAEHSKASTENVSPSMTDVRLAIQARVDQSMSTTWPKEFLLALAASLNKEPLPALPESYGVRLPPEEERLTALNFDLVPKPKPESRSRANGTSENMDAEGEDEDNLFGGSDEDMD